VPKVAGLAAGGDGSLWASTGDICEASSLLGVKHTNQNLVMEGTRENSGKCSLFKMKNATVAYFYVCLNSYRVSQNWNME
jgi:hypothetical protein